MAPGGEPGLRIDSTGSTSSIGTGVRPSSLNSNKTPESAEPLVLVVRPSRVYFLEDVEATRGASRAGA